MVSGIGVAIAVAAAILFFSQGGLKSAQAFLGSDFSGKQQKDLSGQVTTDSLQKNPSIPIPQGSQTTVATIQGAQILRTNVADKRKFDQSGSKPTIRTSFSNPNEGGSEPQQGVIPLSNNPLAVNSSARGVVGLNAQEIGKIRAQPFTEQETQDIESLRLRFKGKSIGAQRVSDSPEEIIFKKREQNAIARKTVESQGGVFVMQGGQQKLNANPNFDLGLPSNATQAEINQAIRGRQEQQLIKMKIEQNKILATQQEKTGEQILQTIAKSGMNQKQFLLNKGIALRGGNLNARALAKLQAGGIFGRNEEGDLIGVTPSFDFSAPSPSKAAEIIAKPTPELTSEQIRNLTDAEKIARFRAGDRRT